MEQRTKNAIALKRVSTDQQDSLRQDEDIEDLRREYGLNIISTLELKGVSGTAMLTHEQVQRILRDLQNPNVHGLVCSAVDRLFRPKRGSDFAIGNAFQDARKNLWTKDDGHIELWTDEGWGRFMEAGVSAGKELRKIRSRIMSGKRKKRKLGRNVSGSVALPRGLDYRRITNGAGKTIDCEWSYNADTEKIREAYRILFADHNISLTALAERVGWPCGFTLRRTLQNPTWRGVRAYPATEDEEAFEVALPLEPLLSPQEWALAQTLLAKRRSWSKETRDQRFLGQGLLVCECGRKYYFHADKRRGACDSYFCSSKFPKGPGCGSARLRRDGVDAAIERLVSEHLTDPKFLAEIFASVERPPAPDLGKRERELAKLAARRQKWIEQYDGDRITKAEFEQKMDAVEKAKHEIEAQMPVAPAPALDVRSVVTGLVRWAVRFPKITNFAEKRKELKRVIRRIPVVEGTVQSFEVCGPFLREISHTNSAQPSRPPWRPHSTASFAPAPPAPRRRSGRGTRSW